MAALDDATAYAQASNYSGSGDWLDESGNGHHATPVNSPTFTDAGADSYFTCVNTSSQYFAIADHANLQVAAGDSATWAIVFWRIAQVAGHDGLLMKKNSLTDNSRGWGLGTQASNIKAAIGDGAANAQPTRTTVSDGVRYVAVGRRNVAADNVVAALDGTLSTAVTDPTTTDLIGNAELRICRYSGVGTNYAHARIYAWAFWRRALSDAEISGLGAEFFPSAPASRNRFLLLGIGV